MSSVASGILSSIEFDAATAAAASEANTTTKSTQKAAIVRAACNFVDDDGIGDDSGSVSACSGTPTGGGSSMSFLWVSVCVETFLETTLPRPMPADNASSAMLS